MEKQLEILSAVAFGKGYRVITYKSGKAFGFKIVDNTTQALEYIIEGIDQEKLTRATIKFINSL